MTYSILDEIVLTYEPTISAAEIHGVATGMLCMNSSVGSIVWLAEVFQDSSTMLEEDKATLVDLFEQTQVLLTGDEFAFDLFIPDDECTLDAQAEGIRNWCQGFLLGVGFSSTDSQWSNEVQEIIRDIVEINKLELIDDETEDEQALMEIHEFLRVGVMLVREELHDEDSSDRQQLH